MHYPDQNDKVYRQYIGSQLQHAHRYQSNTDVH